LLPLNLSVKALLQASHSLQQQVLFTPQSYPHPPEFTQTYPTAELC
jgi:hypothetical protein